MAWQDSAGVSSTKGKFCTLLRQFFLIQQQLDVDRWWSKNKEPLVKQGFDLEDVKHAMGLVSGSLCPWASMTERCDIEPVAPR